MSRVRVETVIAELARDWELPELILDENDYVCLQGADGTIVNIDYFEEDAALSLYVTVAPNPEQDRAVVYQLMLEGNCNWSETAGTTLALDETGEYILLTAALEAATLDLDGLVQQIERLLTTATDWAEYIKSLLDETPTTTESAEPVDFA